MFYVLMEKIQCEGNFDDAGGEEENWSKILHRMRGNGAQ